MWKCDVCGYVHRGDEPPEICPICGVGRDRFSRLEVDSAKKNTISGVGMWRCTICNYVHEGEVPEKCPVCAADASLFEADEEAPKAVTEGHLEHVVIVGAGIAGITAAEQVLLEKGGHAAITIVSDEPGLPYYRLNLTRLMALQIPESALTMKPLSFFNENPITLVEGAVRSIVQGDKQVKLKDGTVIKYDALILANGAHAFIPPIAGVEKQGVHPLRTLADAHAILSELSPDANVIVVGCGVLGLEAAGAISNRVKSVTVLESAQWAMVRQLNRAAGNRLVAYLKTRNIEVMTGVTIKAIEGDASVRCVVLEDGTRLDADVVVVSTGVRPNMHLAKSCGIETARGILVDDHMRTSHPDVYAAGDVAEHRGVVYGLWPSAFTQGFVAGTCAAGGFASFKSMAPFNQLKVLDVELYSIGQIEPLDGSYSVFEAATESVYHYLVMHDRKLVGAVLFGNTSLAPAISEAIEAGTCIDELQTLLEALPGLDAFAQK